MSKEFSPEIMTYHAMQSEVSKIQVRMEKLANQIIEDECPFKKGEVVEYSEWWRPNLKQLGQIDQIYFKGHDANAIDGLWRFIIIPLTKKLLPHNGRGYAHIGKDLGDTIKTYNS